MTVDGLDPYAVLQVVPDADDAVIAAAYRALARRFHPDVAGELALGSMRSINAAWEILRSPERRAAYDRQRGRFVHPRPLHTHPAPSVPGHAHIRGYPHAVRRAASGAATGSADGTGAAGPPPGRPSGSVLPFGRHIGWSLGEIARIDPGYLHWLEDRPEGVPYRAEIDALLHRMGRRQKATGERPRRSPWRR